MNRALIPQFQSIVKPFRRRLFIGCIIKDFHERLFVKNTVLRYMLSGMTTLFLRQNRDSFHYVNKNVIFQKITYTNRMIVNLFPRIFFTLSTREANGDKRALVSSGSLQEDIENLIKSPEQLSGLPETFSPFNSRVYRHKLYQNTLVSGLGFNNSAHAFSSLLNVMTWKPVTHIADNNDIPSNGVSGWLSSVDITGHNLTGFEHSKSMRANQSSEQRMGNSQTHGSPHTRTKIKTYDNFYRINTNNSSRDILHYLRSNLNIRMYGKIEELFRTTQRKSGVMTHYDNIKSYSIPRFYMNYPPTLLRYWEKVDKGQLMNVINEFSRTKEQMLSSSFYKEYASQNSYMYRSPADSNPFLFPPEMKLVDPVINDTRVPEESMQMENKFERESKLPKIKPMAESFSASEIQQLTDRVYEEFERKLRNEKERRGL